jgi:hypothetical protein
LVTEFQKKIFFLWAWTSRRCLTPASSEYFVARQDKVAGHDGDRESVTLQAITTRFVLIPVAPHKE